MASALHELFLGLVLVSLPLISLVIALAPPLLMARRGHSALATGLWLLALTLLAVWVFVEMRAGIRADETGTGGNILALAEMIWWYAAVAVGAGAVASALRAGAGAEADGASPRGGEAWAVVAGLVGFICVGMLLLGPVVIFLLPVAVVWAVRRLRRRNEVPPPPIGDVA